MTTASTFAPSWPTFRAVSTVDWHRYAHCYDLLCSINPAYFELIEEFRSFLARIDLRPDSRILDLGGGTGNFFCVGIPEAIARSSDLTHLDFDSEMIKIAADKYDQMGLKVKMMHSDASKTVFPVGSLDCVVTVNALYAMPTPVSILKRIFHWLRPGGHLFVVNLGRVQNTTDWTSFIIRNNIRRMGLVGILRILLNEGMVISKENRVITRAQRSGVYWQHGTEEFGNLLRDIGFQTDVVRPVYRGYSDLAYCRKPTATAI